MVRAMTSSNESQRSVNESCMCDQTPDKERLSEVAKHRAITGLALVGFGTVWLGLGFLVGISRAKRKAKDVDVPRAFRSADKEGARIARRALAFGTLGAFVGVGSAVGLTCFMLDIRSLNDLKEISRAATESNSTPDK